ncbi:MAG: hypothetical protein RMJ82_08560 [Gemmatales bacterium]|nr:hypothetical protein [Gemmatales bacterium]
MVRHRGQHAFWSAGLDTRHIAGRDTRQRALLLARFADRIVPYPELNRALVSYQANRFVPLLRWFRYKEGFSYALVQSVVQKLELAPGKLLDPFAGVGTALLAARDFGWQPLGIELLPIGPWILKTWLSAEQISP